MSYVSPRTGLGASTSSTIEASVGSALASAVPLSGPAAPFVAIAAGIAELMATLGIGSGCGATCVQSSNFANQVQAPLEQNISTYFAITPPRPQSAQTAALAVFDTMWAQLQQACGNTALGAAGQRCITDRQAGACTWKQTADKVPPWGTPPTGSCWNWFNGFRDPIANDPNVVPDAELATASGAASGTATGAAATAGLSSSTWLLLAAGLGLAVWGLS
jgi:hypothetical protein